MEGLSRALVFIDGNNWYHALTEEGVAYPVDLDYRAISTKLAGPARRWIGTRYYIGEVQRTGNLSLHASQRRFLASLQATDSRITVHLGRMESHPVDNEGVKEIKRYLAALPVRIDRQVYADLIRIASKHERVYVFGEKAVDVNLAVDMVMMAERDEYDHAYLLSRDSDFTPAVTAVRSMGRKVYVASPSPGAQLGAVADSSIRLTRDWFSDCYK